MAARDRTTTTKCQGMTSIVQKANRNGVLALKELLEFGSSIPAECPANHASRKDARIQPNSSPSQLPGQLGKSLTEIFLSSGFRNSHFE